MQPTTNTPFERFAFVAMIVLMISFPFLVIGLILLMSVVFPANLEHQFVIGWINAIGWAITLGIPIFCIVCAIKIERDHMKALAKAETELSDIIVSDLKTLPSNWQATQTVFIAESVVIANDYLKSFLWAFRKLVGGESKSLSRLLSRARREATVRVLRKAKACGANVIWNIRYETSAVHSIFTGDSSRNMITGVELLAYATAFSVTAE
jgi:uncharacterized protein YbjQ (UPF0145 family)